MEAHRKLEYPPITWLSPDGTTIPSPTALHPLGRITAAARVPAQFVLPASARPTDITVEITAHYRLVSDPETPVSKAAGLDIPVVSPMTLAHDWTARVHPGKWPSYFILSEDDILKPGEDGKPRAMGLSQRWCLLTNLTNIEAEGDDETKSQTDESQLVSLEASKPGTPLVVVGWELQVPDVGGGARCTVFEGPPEGEETGTYFFLSHLSR